MEAVKDSVGGSNPALAQTIAGEHSSATGNHIYSSLLPCNLCMRSMVIYIYDLHGNVF